MILQNEDYRERGTAIAMDHNIRMTKEDRKGWFYKKWPGLTSGTGREGELEKRLESRLKSAKDLYRGAYERGVIPYPTTVPFAAYKEEMGAEEDTLMDVLRRMPKGGLLHVHSAAALSVEGLIDLLREWKGCPIYITTAGDNEGKMNYLSDNQALIPGREMLLDDFWNILNAERRLRNWLTVGRHTDNAEYIWDEFNKIFVRTSALFADMGFYFEYHRRFFLECLRDRIDYVELRCGFQDFVSQENEVKKNVILDQSPEFLDVLERAKDAAMQEYRETREEGDWNPPYGEIGLGVILCARRDLDPDDLLHRLKLMRKMDTAIAWKLGQYSKLIKGFDFVSEEDRGKTSYSYYKDIIYGEVFDGYEEGSPEEAAFKPLKLQHKLIGVSRVEMIELMLHAGESLWMEQENIIDAKIASKSRMGHGFQMLEFPAALMDYLYSRCVDSPSGPVLEVCPISNQMLRYFPDIRNHYALMLMKMGVPCVLSNDDPQILGNPGLSYDFWEMYMASDGGLMMVKGLVFTAFVFQYQDRVGIALSEWEDGIYADCLQDFKDKYWMPFLEEMNGYFEDEA
ncbi:MAG: hypothetical protein HDR05_08010 [Lachnospiraceae bacterium]|nr:hypothetical protein [Lachnospiraceae bacterium]